jgi:thioredoxin
MGYQKVYELNGGINAWKAANKSLEGKTASKQMSLDEFNSAVAAGKTVLVDFGAAWCPPCKAMEPVIKSLQQKYSGSFTLLKVDGGNDQDVMRQYQVTALPVFLVFRNGKSVWRKDGVATENEIAAQLK